MCKQVGKAVSAMQLGMTADDWEVSLEVEAFLNYPFVIKDTIEHKGYLTGAQALILLNDLKDGCHRSVPLTVRLHPESATLKDRTRKEQPRRSSTLSWMTLEARRLMQRELEVSRAVKR